MKVTLTESQSLALEKLKGFVNSNEKYFRLTGYASTGKSSMTMFPILTLLRLIKLKEVVLIIFSLTPRI